LLVIIVVVSLSLFCSCIFAAVVSCISQRNCSIWEKSVKLYWAPCTKRKARNYFIEFIFFPSTIATNQRQQNKELIAIIVIFVNVFDFIHSNYIQAYVINTNNTHLNLRTIQKLWFHTKYEVHNHQCCCMIYKWYFKQANIYPKEY